MPVTIAIPAESPVLRVLGEELRPLTPAGQGLAVHVFGTTAPAGGPGEAGPPPHRHPWDEIYVVLDGTLEVFDGETWHEAKQGACVTVPADQVHAYRNGTADCRFLTITGPGRGREFFERADAEIGWPPDMDLAVAVAARFGLKVLLPDRQANPGSRRGHYDRGDTTPWRVRR